MVFDYAEYDLTGLMESQKYNFTEPQVRGVGQGPPCAAHAVPVS